MTASNPPTFDLAAELPGPGVTLLEASAGTGKTYAIAGLVARFVADGVPLHEILVVTFTKAATSELRDRVRGRLLQVGAALSLAIDRGSGEPDATHDPVTAALLASDPGIVQQRYRRIQHALANFDSATITTTHGFCEAALAELGLAGDSELRPQFVPDVAEMVEQVATDLYVAGYYGNTHPEFGPARAQALAREAHHAWDAEIEPASSANVGTAHQISFAKRTRAEIDRRKRLAGLMTYDDQVGRLMRAVTDHHRGPEAIRMLRDRYRVVLVDEFQDTDESQWTIFAETFVGAGTRLILIGDPKQAIYSFRGADVFAYLAAARTADTRATLATNYRSTTELVEGLNLLFGQLELGDPQIRYRATSAAKGSSESSRPAVLFRRIGEDANVPRSSRGSETLIQVKLAGDAIAADLAAHVVRRLEDLTPCVSVSGGVFRKIRPGDIAVLTNSNAQADSIAAALRARSVPAVVRGSQSVLTTSAAKSIRTLAQALARPSSDQAVRRLAATELIGATAKDLVDPKQQQIVSRGQHRLLLGLHSDVQRWAEMYSEAGIEPVFASIKEKFQLSSRLLGFIGGERFLTDVEQVIDLVAARAASEGRQLTSLIEWLLARERKDGQSDANERARRIDTDAEAVQVITTHSAKGLEFEVVYCPYLWTSFMHAKSGDILRYHDKERRKLFVADSSDAGFRSAADRQDAEAMGESLRKAYVAMTRARSELVVYWGRGPYAEDAPLSVILGQHGHDTKSAFDSLSAHPQIAIEDWTTEPETRPWSDPDIPDQPTLGLSVLDREIDTAWRRTSFSALTAAAYDAHLQGSHGSDAGVDEADVAVADEVDSATSSVEQPGVATEALAGRVSKMSEIVGGARFGTFVHELFEVLDFTDADIAEQATVLVGKGASSLQLSDTDQVNLVGGLVDALATPLGQDLGGARLMDVGTTDRIDEMSFEFALAGGDSPIGTVRVSSIAEVLDRTLDPSDHLRGYLDHLREPVLQADVRGYLSGSVDLVLRTRTGAGDRFSVIDYKTNRLGAGPLTAWEYRPEAVQAAVFDANYPLQFLLYTVALHRYLRSRLTDYDPAKHLGPVKYLFIRGMLGADAPTVAGQPCGVFTWQPTADVVEALSELLANGVVE